MADPIQTRNSAIPSDFMPRLRDFLAESLAAHHADVRLGVEETTDQKPHSIMERGVVINLGNPVAVNPNAGAGRHGFPLTRKLYIQVRTRGGLDVAGEDEQALVEHWDFQDRILNALLVLAPQHPESIRPLTLPIQYLGGSDKVDRVQSSGSAYESVLVFILTYVPRVDLP